MQNKGEKNKSSYIQQEILTPGNPALLKQNELLLKTNFSNVYIDSTVCWISKYIFSNNQLLVFACATTHT